MLGARTAGHFVAVSLLGIFRCVYCWLRLGVTLLDQNECERGTDKCAYNQICNNLNGTYACSCRRGYRTDGPGKPCVGKLHQVFLLLCASSSQRPGPEHGAAMPHPLVTSAVVVSARIIVRSSYSQQEPSLFRHSQLQPLCSTAEPSHYSNNTAGMWNVSENGNYKAQHKSPSRK